MATVVSCDGCARFVRSLDSECPFCGAHRTPQKLSLHAPRVARAALVAMAISGCGEKAPPVSIVQPAYGAPAMESGGGEAKDPVQDDTSSTETDDSSADESNDESKADGSTRERDQEMVPLYGAPY